MTGKGQALGPVSTLRRKPGRDPILSRPIYRPYIPFVLSENL